MGVVKQIGRESSRKSLKASASLLGLAAGAVGWSGLAQAASEETGSQMMLLPEHYDLMENGVVVFKLETGENLSLTADQYLILEDGLLLITDELAQASIYSLPVMGSVRAQLLSDLEQVATIDGTVAEATPAQTLSITEGQAPRLSEQVELRSYEIAQASDESSSEAEEALALGMSVAPGAMALLGMLMTSDQPEPEYVLRQEFDINPDGGGSDPQQKIVIDGKMYFSANTGDHGRELWVFDGENPPYMVADINPGTDGSFPRAMTGFNGKIVFRANDGTNGSELWEHDPATGTTSRVDDINPDFGSSSPNNFTVFQNNLYFTAQDGSNGTSAYMYDGVNTPVRIDINSTGAENVGESAVFRGDLYIAADDGSGIGKELFVTTNGVTFTLVQDINVGSDSNPYNFVNFNNKLLFAANNGTDGIELFEYDGTSALMIDDINPAGSSFPSEYTSASILNDKLYFRANDGTTGSELYSYDGTSIKRLGDLNPGGGTGVADDVTAFDGKIYFEGDDGVLSTEFWSYGEKEGFILVADIRPGSLGSQAEDFVVYNDTLYFSANDAEVTNQELWAYGYL